MRRLAPLLLALAALAVLVPAAHAKELMALKACGPDGCRDVDDPSRLVGGVIEGDLGEPPSGAAPFMRLRIGVATASGSSRASPRRSCRTPA